MVWSDETRAFLANRFKSTKPTAGRDFVVEISGRHQGLDKPNLVAMLVPTDPANPADLEIGQHEIPGAAMGQVVRSTAADGKWSLTAKFSGLAAGLYQLIVRAEGPVAQFAVVDASGPGGLLQVA